jgi:hypothetical protein
MTASDLIDFDALAAAPVDLEPYPHFLGAGFLRSEAVPALRADFPDLKKPGFLLASDVELKGRFKDLVEAMEGEEVTEALSQKFGQDLHPFPRLTTIRKVSQLKDGRPHTDGRDKVMTVLVYMNDAWDDDGAGRLRVLYGPDDFEKMKLEVPPTMGTVFGFLRSDHSWHGHLPFAGERRVLQIAWVRDQAAIDHKTRRNRTASFLKGIFGR